MGGCLETLQQPTINAAQKVEFAHYPIDGDRSGRPLCNQRILQALIKRVVDPLSAVKIDLNASRADIEKTVTEFLPKEKVRS